ncbi:MAG: heavy metal translocating P-type ATPase [Betaproteobacteria bacterium]
MKPESSLTCYHCGLPIPPAVNLAVDLGGMPRAMCCAGCQAVAQAIVDNGLEDYYRSRDSLPESPREAVPAVLDRLALYDHEEFQRSFVRALEGEEREASLLLEGITCAACIWLNERHVSQLPGVTAVAINYATRRARVRWDASRIKLSDILAAIAAIGYRAYPYDAARNEEVSRKERRDAIWRLWVAGFGMMQVMMYAIPVYLADAGDMTPDIERLMRWASLLLTLPVVFYSSAPFFRNAWRDLRLRRVGMDVPVALGIGTAFIASIWATLTQSGEVYFDSVAMFVFFLLGGRYLEMTARQKAVSASEALARLLPAFASRLPRFPDDEAVEAVMVSDLRAGDVVLVRAGEIFPADAEVLVGESQADESLLTGESQPVPKVVGAAVTGGTLNTDSPLTLRVVAVGEGTRLSAIIHLMERASMEKPRIVETADRIAGAFVWSVLAMALLTAVLWMSIEPARALWITVSVLVVTCPCALSLATPIALTIAAGALAKDGLLLTRGHAIETLARATHFVFDKTGTLTLGRLRLLDILPLGEASSERCLALAAALEQTSEHPVAAALRGLAPELRAFAVVNTPGQGLEAQVDGRCYRIGKAEYALALSGRALPAAAVEWLTSGDTVVTLADEVGALALLRFSDAVRPEARALVACLHATGRRVILLTGDGGSVAQQVAGELGITETHAGMSPQDKHAFVAELQVAGAVVAMVGDGINDAPVLARAQVSVAMGGGAQLARAQADFILLSENLDHLRRGVVRAGFALKVIRQNLGWAFAYNIVALPLAVAGHVTPWLAGIGMSASSLLVVLNALRIQRPMDD